MTFPESVFLFIGIISYSASFVSLLLRKERGSALLLGFGILAHLVSAGVRWYGIGHPPVFGTFEAALAGSWFILLYTIFSFRSAAGHFRLLSLTTIPFAVLILSYGLTFNTGRIPLTISERSLWVDFHALFAWLAFGGYTAASCLAVCYLILASRSLLSADAETMDDLIFRYINLGFINQTAMFALGSYYSSILFGVWWQWDIANSTSLITWLAYGLSIHMRLFYGWKGKRGANLAIAAFLTAVVSYWGLIYFPPGSTYHVFDIEFKTH